MIMDVFLDGVAMMIAICLVVVVCAFAFWAVAATVRLIRRSGFIADVGSALVLMWTETLKELGLFSPPDVEPITWCQGCDELVKSERMAFTDGWRYRCEDCRRPRRQFVMDVSSVEDVKAGREVLAVHNGGQVSVIRSPLTLQQQRKRALDTAMRAAVMQEAQKIRHWVDLGDDDRRR